MESDCLNFRKAVTLFFPLSNDKQMIAKFAAAARECCKECTLFLSSQLAIEMAILSTVREESGADCPPPATIIELLRMRFDAIAILESKGIPMPPEWTKGTLVMPLTEAAAILCLWWVNHEAECRSCSEHLKTLFVKAKRIEEGLRRVIQNGGEISPPEYILEWLPVPPYLM